MINTFLVVTPPGIRFTTGRNRLLHYVCEFVSLHVYVRASTHFHSGIWVVFCSKLKFFSVFTEIRITHIFPFWWLNEIYSLSERSVTTKHLAKAFSGIFMFLSSFFNLLLLTSLSLSLSLSFSLSLWLSLYSSLYYSPPYSLYLFTPSISGSLPCFSTQYTVFLCIVWAVYINK